MISVQKQPLIIFDTTLRDGEQSPGVTLTVDEKIEIARQLSRLGVDVCEAGFPVASHGDFEAVKRIAIEVGPLTIGRTKPPMVIAGLARATHADIQRAFDAVKYAPFFRIHTFLATSDIHLQHKLKISRDQCVERATDAIRFAKSLGVNDIEFSPEDAGRSDLDFLCHVLGACIEAGATTLNIPDTVGYNLPNEYGNMIKYLIQNTCGSDKVIWSCHYDKGLATANTLAGINNGALQVEVTVNGIGERAGNTSLEEIVMAIHTHPSSFPVYHTIDTTQIYNTSQLITKRTGMPIQPNKAIVGANAFLHESGIHQDGMLKNKETYEIIQPHVIGLVTNTLVLGKHSGRNAFKNQVQSMLLDSPYQIQPDKTDEILEILFNQFKKLADSKKSGVTDEDLIALIDNHFQVIQGPELYSLKSIQVVSGTECRATASVCIIKDGDEYMDAAIGIGSIDAIFCVINRLIGTESPRMVSYDVKSITGGTDALGKVIVGLEGVKLNEVVIGQASDEDILVASAKAYLNAFNRLIQRRSAYSSHVRVDEDLKL